MKVLKNAVLSHKKAKLLRIIGSKFVTESVRHKAVKAAEKHITPEFAAEILSFVKRHQEIYDNALDDVWGCLLQPQHVRQLRIAINHFEYALELGWLYRSSAMLLIWESLSEHYDLTIEQERALIRLEDSRWYKEYTVDGGRCHKVNEYGPCVAQFVASNPEKVEAVIAVASIHPIKHEGQLVSLLEGRSTPVLTDGAL